MTHVSLRRALKSGERHRMRVRFIPQGTSLRCPWATVHGRFFFQGLLVRVTAFVDGFNLYHALDDLGQHHLKWLNLRALCQHFAPQPQFQLDAIYYFSAYATWRVRAYRRHRGYVTALRAVGVTPILGRFKIKNRQCRRCGTSWQDHEEKETDVKMALRLLLVQ